MLLDEDGKALDSSAVYRKAVVTSELLIDKNKYWCAACLRYNEARRAVCYPSLPRLLVLQLKRFSTAAGYKFISFYVVLRAIVYLTLMKSNKQVLR